MVEHYFSQKPASTFRSEQFKTNILGNDIKINSGSGIFSCDRIDFGTRLLIEHAAIKSSKTINNKKTIKSSKTINNKKTIKSSKTINRILKRAYLSLILDAGME